MYPWVALFQRAHSVRLEDRLLPCFSVSRPRNPPGRRASVTFGDKRELVGQIADPRQTLGEPGGHRIVLPAGPGIRAGRRTPRTRPHSWMTAARRVQRAPLAAERENRTRIEAGLARAGSAHSQEVRDAHAAINRSWQAKELHSPVVGQELVFYCSIVWTPRDHDVIYMAFRDHMK
jgi:hypothetical protein